MDVGLTGGDERRSRLWESNGSGTHFWIDHRCDQESLANTSAFIHGDQHGELICDRRDSLYGYRGVRVGEASHPGPNPRRRRRVSSSRADISQQSAPDPTLLDDLEQDLGTQVDVSPDKVLAMRPNCGRHVVPRTSDASPGGALRETIPQMCATEISHLLAAPSGQAGYRPVVHPMGQRPTVLQWSGFIFRRLGG